jgi:hypothetical protein
MEVLAEGLKGSIYTTKYTGEEGMPQGGAK